MSTLGATPITLVDWAKTRDPDGSTARVAELLSQSNEILQDIPWIEGNLPTGHQSTVRTGLPSATWRLLNQGVAGSKSTTAQITEACGMLESWCEVDVELAKLNGDAAAYRAQEGLAHVESMNQEFAQTLFYGNAGTAPEEFNGFATRYSALGQNCISGGSVSGSDGSSIYLIGWGPMAVHGVFPKGSKAGLEHNDFGEQTIETVAGIQGTRLRVYQDQWKWNCGLVVKDWRFAVRVANIDISALVAESSASNLIKLMTKATYRLPTLNYGTTPDGVMVGAKPVFYMNRTCLEMLDIQRHNAMTGFSSGTTYTGGSIKYEEIDGRLIPHFRNIPIRIVDQLTETEAAVA